MWERKERKGERERKEGDGTSEFKFVGGEEPEETLSGEGAERLVRSLCVDCGCQKGSTVRQEKCRDVNNTRPAWV